MVVQLYLPSKNQWGWGEGLIDFLGPNNQIRRELRDLMGQINRISWFFVCINQPFTNIYIYIQCSCRLACSPARRIHGLQGVSNHAIFGTQDCVAGTIGLYDMDSHPCATCTCSTNTISIGWWWCNTILPDKYNKTINGINVLVMQVDYWGMDEFSCPLCVKNKR